MTIVLKPYASKLIKEVTVSLIKAPWFEVKNKPSVLWPGVCVKELGTRSPAQGDSSRGEIREGSFLLRCHLNAAAGQQRERKGKSLEGLGGLDFHTKKWEMEVSETAWKTVPEDATDTGCYQTASIAETQKEDSMVLAEFLGWN